MPLSDFNEIKSLLRKHGFTFSKALGQNFLINPDVCPRMAESCVNKDSGVLEIGPGIGVLTRELAARAKKTVAVEIDERLRPLLAETLRNSGAEIIFGDIMKLDLQELISREFSGMPVSVCANLPYYITSPIVMLLLESCIQFNNITVMVQKEAARRICAPVGTRESGAITAAVHYYSEPEILFDVSADSFLPAPKVDSSVIQLKVRSVPAVEPENKTEFFRIIKAAFAQRRKTAVNSISAGLGIPKLQVAEALRALNISENERAERLTLQQFADIQKILG